MIYNAKENLRWLLSHSQLYCIKKPKLWLKNGLQKKRNPWIYVKHESIYSKALYCQHARTILPYVFLYLTLPSVFKRVFLCVQCEQCFLVFSLHLQFHQNISLFQMFFLEQLFSGWYVWSCFYHCWIDCYWKITFFLAYSCCINWTLIYKAQSLYFHVKHFQSCSANHKINQSKAFHSVCTILFHEKPTKPTRQLSIWKNYYGRNLLTSRLVLQLLKDR